MSEILQSLERQLLVPAMEANMAEEMATFGRYLPGAELHEDAELQWFITGFPSPIYNGVLRTTFANGDVDAKIEQIIRYFQARSLPFSWPVNSSTRPANLRTYLEAHGFVQVHEAIRMAADLQALNEQTATPPGFTIEEINDLETLKQWQEVTMRGFEDSRELTQLYYDTYARAGFGEDKPWHHYIGRLNDEPVAISSLLLHAGVAGIFGVATVPEVRRMGIGAAMTLAPLLQARSLGYRVGILAPSEMGLGVYRRLGFQEFCTVGFFRLESPGNSAR